MSANDRPKEVHWWIKRNKSIEKFPLIENPSEYGATWKRWWIAIQPEWREGESFVKTVPADADWTNLRCGGSNGLALVVMALSWWVGATGTPDSDLTAAIDDVKWVVSELVMTLSSTAAATGSKRPSDSSPDEPRSKR